MEARGDTDGSSWFPPQFPSGELELNSFIRSLVVLDLSSNLKWVTSKGFFGEPLKHVTTLRA